MVVNFRYEEDENVRIDSISVVGEFNEFNPDKGIMEKTGNVWNFDLELPFGEYKYKFLINQNLRLNDSEANLYMPDDNEELWSLIIINEEGIRLYNNEEYSVNIDSYYMNSMVSEADDILLKKAFNTNVDEKAVVRYGFTNVTGIHTVTVAWYNPHGQLVQYTDNNLFKGEEDKEPLFMWFWLDLKENKAKLEYGNWTIKLFINGQFILADRFSISNASSYSSKGELI